MAVFFLKKKLISLIMIGLAKDGGRDGADTFFCNWTTLYRNVHFVIVWPASCQPEKERQTLKFIFHKKI